MDTRIHVRGKRAGVTRTTLARPLRIPRIQLLQRLASKWQGNLQLLPMLNNLFLLQQTRENAKWSERGQTLHPIIIRASFQTM